jgi:hypothetical protein
MYDECYTGSRTLKENCHNMANIPLLYWRKGAKTLLSRQFLSASAVTRKPGREH